MAKKIVRPFNPIIFSNTQQHWLYLICMGFLNLGLKISNPYFFIIMTTFSSFVPPLLSLFSASFIMLLDCNNNAKKQYFPYTKENHMPNATSHSGLLIYRDWIENGCWVNLNNSPDSRGRRFCVNSTLSRLSQTCWIWWLILPLIQRIDREYLRKYWVCRSGLEK